jgi:fibronectin type 3 domain-containing protein
MKKRNILIFSVIIILCFSACGKKAPPKPEGLPLAGGINDLSGEVKDGVLFLSFTVPQKNRDGSEIKDLWGFRVFKSCGTCQGAFEPFRNICFEETKGYTIENGRLYMYDDDVTAGFEYGYKVYPYTKKGTRGDASNTFTIKWEDPPDVPQGVTVSVDDGMVELKWQRENGCFYNVYRYNNGAYPLFALNQNRLAADSFMDVGVSNNREYTYEVRKVKEIGGVFREGEGVKINAVPLDKTPPRRPEMVTTAKKGNIVSIAWAENADKDLAGYNIYRIVRDTKERINKDPVKETSFFDSKIPDERFVSYCVTALDRTGNESEPSRESIIILKEE